MAEQTPGDKFPLLIYRRWARMLRLPGLLIAVASGAVWWFAPNDPLLAERDWVFIVLGLVGGLIFLYSLWVRQMAYVRCYPDYLKIRTPFMAVAISYKRILQVRPVEFHMQLPLSKMKRTQRRLLEPFLTQTVIVLELRQFPTSERRLRTWLPWFMFASQVTGFVLVTNDWMTLSRQVSAFSDRWTVRRQAQQRPSTGLFH